jgi:hypothetical protein
MDSGLLHGGRSANPYTRAYRREGTPAIEREASEARRQLVVQNTHNGTAAARIWRAKSYGTEQALARSNAFEQSAAAFMTLATPTVRDLVDHLNRMAGLQGRTRSTSDRTLSSLVLSRTNIGARVTVQ